MTVFQAFLCGLACWLVTASPLNGGQFNQVAAKPLTAAFFCGLITGNMKLAMEIGVPIQAMYLGQMAIGGVSTMPSANISLYFIIPLTIASGMDAEYAIAMAVPFGVVEQVWNTLKLQLDLIPVHLMQSEIKKGNVGGAVKSIYLGWVIQGVATFFIPFLACIVGQDALIAVAQNMPGWLNGILNTFRTLCPLIGFSLLLNCLVTDKFQLIYVVFGFTLAKMLGMSILGVTIVACCIAYLYFILTADKNAVEEV